MMNSLTEVIAALEECSNAYYREAIARYRVPNEKALGIKSPDLRKLGRTIGVNHSLALQLWNCGIHEAKTLAGYIADPKQITEAQVDQWVNEFYSWDICDNTCNFLVKTPFTYQKVIEWSSAKKEFVKRAGFVMMVNLAIHDKKASDEVFVPYFPIIEREAWDERNFVKKAINWALRQLGKRSLFLHSLAIKTAHSIKAQGTKPAKWIANDALRELLSPKVIARLNKKNSHS